MELAEEQLWNLFAMWQGINSDIMVDYPDTFDLRDYGTELEFLQRAKASGVNSPRFNKGVDKAIAELVLTDDDLAQAITEIDSARTLGQFSEPNLALVANP